ncbi:MAG: RluA family pseudouridine synthase [Parachlamydiales bacterium]|nr:RluA family pseudouridine synthase [Parachlamydiales bacterium]
MLETDTFLISEETQGQRIDKLLALQYPDKARHYFQSLLEQGLVLVNGNSVKKREKPKCGDEVEVQFALTPEMGVTPENIPLDILYEDDYIIAVNKPASMVVHPAPGNWNKTFANALLYHCKNLYTENPLRPGIVHRLDKDTTGVLIAAKTEIAHKNLVKAFSSREIHKEYLALCSGKVLNKTINNQIGRHPVIRTKMAVVENGKEAISHMTLVAYQDHFSLVSVQIETGRTHQIRVHLQHANHPVLGDDLYGSVPLNRRYNLNRQMLHAYKTTLIHPITHQQLVIKAALPEDFSSFINANFSQNAGLIIEKINR